MKPGRHVDVDADRLVGDVLDGLQAVATLPEGHDLRGGDGNPFAHLLTREHTVHGADVGVGQRPRVRVGLEQAIVERRHARHEDVGLRQVAQASQCERLIGADYAVDARRPRRCNLQPVVAHARAIHFEDLHVNNDLGFGLVDGAQEPRHRIKTLGRVSNRQRIRADRLNTSDVGHHPKQIDHFLHVQVADKEGANLLFGVLAALVRIVGDDGDGLGRRDLVERARVLGHRVERLAHRRFLQADRNGRILKLGIEHQAETRQLAQHRVDLPAGGLRAGVDRCGHRRIGQLKSARR